jgi:Family of unknown function (DUF6427)
LIGLFQKRSPVNVVWLLVFAIAIKLPLFLRPQSPVLQVDDPPLYRALVQWIQQTGTLAPAFFSFLSFIFSVSIALLLNYFFQQQKMASRPTDLPGMSYLLLSSFFPDWSYLSSASLTSLLLVYLLFSLFRLYNQSEVRRSLFNMGLVVGLSPFIFSPTLLLGIWLLAAILIMRPFRVKEFLLTLLGVFTPFYFFGVWLFVTDRWSTTHWLPEMGIHVPVIQSSVWVAGAAFLLLIPLLVGAYSVSDNARKMLIQVRRGWTVLTFLLINTVLLPFLYTQTLGSWQLALIPLAFFHASFYYYTSFRIIPLLFFWLSFFFILATQFSGNTG